MKVNEIVDIKINQINDEMKKNVKQIDNINKQCDKVAKLFQRHHKTK